MAQFLWETSKPAGPSWLKSKPAISQGEDVARSAVSGLAEGTMGLGGLPADIGTAVQDVGNNVFGKYQPKSADEQQVLNDMIGTPGYTRTLPTTPQIEKSVGYTPYQPQTDLGNVTKSVTSFLPAAAGGVVTGGARGLGWGLARQGLAGAASGEAGNIAASVGGEEARPWGQIGGAVLGGYGVTKAGGTASRAATRATAPTIDDLKQSSQALYKAGNDAGVFVRSDVIDNIYKDVVQAGWDKGLRENRPGTEKAVAAAKALADEVTRIGKNGQASVQDLQTMKEILRDAVPEGSAAASAMVGKLVDRIDSLKPGDVVAGVDPKTALNYINEANGLWKQKSKAETIGKIISDAQLMQAEGPGRYPAALRAGFRKLARDPNFAKYWTKDEQYAIKTAAMGGGSGPWLMRQLGPIMGPSQVPVLNAVGATVKGFGNLGTTQASKYADALARSGPNANPFTMMLPVPRTTSDLAAALIGGTVPFRAP